MTSGSVDDVTPVLPEARPLRPQGGGVQNAGSSRNFGPVSQSSELRAVTASQLLLWPFVANGFFRRVDYPCLYMDILHLGVISIVHDSLVIFVLTSL
ncbi:unnamed protein product [Coccothraustes coccothraustes]